MFKVPEWGTDAPDVKINFGRTTHIKKTKKENKPATQESPVKPQANGSIEKKQAPKKSTEKRKLKKIRQKNREIYQKLSKPQTNQQEHRPDHKPGQFVLNPNKLSTKEKGPQKDLTLDNVVNKPQKIKTPKPNKSQKLKNKNVKVINAPIERNGSASKKPKKRKQNFSKLDNIELGTGDPDKAELIIQAKKKKLDDAFKDEDREDVLFGDNAFENSKAKFNPKKEKIRKILESSKRNSINVSNNSNSLRERMRAKLQAAQFRYINEKLYTSSGSEAMQLFQADPAAFDTYHVGYQQQLKKWPVNPLDVIVKRLNKLPASHSVADMGCGTGALARRVRQRVRGFDLVARAPGVEAADMARTPLLTASTDVVVYCLALMGTQLAAYLAEANRVLKIGGLLLIAEVESRFEQLEEFTRGVERLGFKLLQADRSHTVFYFLEFRKLLDTPKKAKHVVLTLKPCLYKKR